MSSARLRQQTIASVLPKDQAKALLADLRDDRRFWAQQRRQFNVLWISIEEGIRAEDRLLAVTTVSFDIAALELYLPLISGATVVLASDAALRDAERLARDMRTHRACARTGVCTERL